MNNVIGVTGRIGSGKTTVARMIAKMLAYEYVSADEIVSSLYHNPAVRRILSKEFGVCSKHEMIEEVTTIERMKRLSDIFHPILVGYFVGFYRPDNCYVIEIPLLFEYNYDYLFDYVINVQVSSDAERYKRLINRGNNTIRTIGVAEKLQMFDEERNERATHVIYNDGTLSELQDDVYMYESDLGG